MCISMMLRWILLLATVLSGLGVSESYECPPPGICLCNKRLKKVSCAVDLEPSEDQSLFEIPQNLDKETEILSLTSFVFPTPRLERANFSRYTKLVTLKMQACSITHIDQNSFVDLIHLKELDLSGNQIEYLPAKVFANLRLTSLQLIDNSQLSIDQNAFEGSMIEKINLEECGLKSLDPVIFAPLQGSLKSLLLSNNEISKFPSAWQSLFITLDSILLSDNPLHCNCESVWLKEFCLNYGNKFVAKACSLKCFDPAPIQGQLLTDVSTDVMCRHPEISAVKISLSRDSTYAAVECEAKGDPKPKITWQNESADVLIDGDTIHLLQPGKITCVATNDGAASTFDVSVTWSKDAPSYPPPDNAVKKIADPDIFSLKLKDQQNVNNRGNRHIQSDSPMFRKGLRFTQDGNNNDGRKVIAGKSRGAVVCPDGDVISKKNDHKGATFSRMHFIIAILLSCFLTFLLCAIVFYCVYRRSYRRYKSEYESKLTSSIDQAKKNLYFLVDQSERIRSLKEKGQYYPSMTQRRYFDSFVHNNPSLMQPNSRKVFVNEDFQGGTPPSACPSRHSRTPLLDSDDPSSGHYHEVVPVLGAVTIAPPLPPGPPPNKYPPHNFF